MGYDAERGRVVLFGGFAGGASLGDTWEWDGSTWTELTPAVSPEPRAGHAMAYDGGRGRVVLFGGNVISGDTWEWNGNTWTQLAPMIAPSSRSLHAMTFDVARGRVVLFGGFDPSIDSSLGDTWEWDGTTWAQRTPATSPSARVGHAMAYDAARGRVVLFGSYNLRDTWEWDGISWTQLAPAASPPSADGGYTMAYDATRRRVVLFCRDFVNVGETWEWDGISWTRLAPPASPPGREIHAMAYDAARGRVVLFGGFDVSINSDLGDTWDLRYEDAGADETCVAGLDGDGDGLFGCDDPDCWGYCTPSCPPGATCDLTAAHCGDGICNPNLETIVCPADCN